MKNMFTYYFAILTLTIPYFAFSQAGTIDKSFGNNGIVFTKVGSSGFYEKAIAIQNDGKIILAGAGGNFIASDFVLVRYNTNGKLDISFGNNGEVITPIAKNNNQSNENDFINSIAIQLDGKIIAVGKTDNGINDDFAIVRYNIDGTIDSTFNNNGIVITNFGTANSEAKSVAIQMDGKIVVTGVTYDTITLKNNLVLVRYLTDGRLDETFGKLGKVITSTGQNHRYMKSVKLQKDGKIVVAGTIYNGINDDFSIMRFTLDGKLDNTFGINGIVTTSIDKYYEAIFSLDIQNDGKIVVAGLVEFENNKFDFALARYDTNGLLDNTFGKNGIVTTDIVNFDDFASSLKIQNDGKILVAGSIYLGSNSTFGFDGAIVRYDQHGKIDQSFGNNGKILLNLDNSTTSNYSLEIQNDGKILIAGTYSENTFPLYFVVSRYNNDITDVETTPNNTKSSLEISPNPFSIQTVLKLPEYLTSGSLTVFNMFGQEVLRQENISSGSITLKRENLPVGVYMIQISKANEIVAMEKLIIVD